MLYNLLLPVVLLGFSIYHTWQLSKIPKKKRKKEDIKTVWAYWGITAILLLMNLLIYLIG